MRKYNIVSTLILILVLTACQSQGAGLAKVVPADHFFDSTPTSSIQKGMEEEAQAHSAATATKTLVSYPTPQATYLVGSNLVTYTSPDKPTNTPTQIVPSATTAPANTATHVPATLAATATQVLATSTKTTVPSATFTPTRTKTSVPGTATASPTATVQVYLYGPQSGTPIQSQNFVNSTSGCSWQGIAGQVFDKSGNPVSSVVVKGGGTWNGSNVTLLGLTGAATGYGEGGYELVLGTKAVASTQTVWVQLYDLAGKSLSKQIYVSTSSDCTKNLVILNFIQVSQ
jgi:hypothetical protein